MENAIGYITKINLESRKVYIYCFDSNEDSPYNIKTNNFNPHPNTLIKIQTGFDIIILKIVGAQYVRNRTTGGEIYKELEAIIYGSFINQNESKSFIKSSFALPIILGSRVYQLSFDDLNLINNKKRFENEYPVGKDLENEYFDVKVNLNNFFVSHIGIFGNTGSGKSVTLAKIFKDFISKKDSLSKEVKLFLFDFNNEYSKSICDDNVPDFLKINYLNKNDKNEIKKIPIKFSEFNEDIWCNVLNATKKTQAPLIKKTWSNFKKIVEKNDSEIIKEYIRDIIFDICKYNKNDILIKFLNVFENLNFLFKDDDSFKKFKKNIRKIKIKKTPSGTGNTSISNENSELISLHDSGDERICVLINENILTTEIDFRADLTNDIDFFVFLILYNITMDGRNEDWLLPVYNRSIVIRNNFSKIFELIKEKEHDNVLDFFNTTNNCLNIFNLQNFSDNDKNIIINLITSLILNKAHNNEKNTNYVNIIIDEAHNVTNKVEDDENFSSLNILKKIIREGRKYGLFLTLASQRPSDIPPDILSQIHNFIIHKLINNKDIEIIKQTNSYVGDDKINLISTLTPGQCLVSGVAFDDPKFIKIDINDMDAEKPDSENLRLFVKK